MSERTSRFSPEDRAAFFDARVAAIHAGLHLTPDQEKLWPAVESAARDAARTMADQREKSPSAGAQSNPVDRLQRASDRLIARGQALKKLADAAQPLFATLTDEQKQRLPMLMRAGHHGGRERAGMEEGQRDTDRSGERDRFGGNGAQQDRYRGSDEDEGFGPGQRGHDSDWRQDRRRGADDDRDFNRRDQGHDSSWRHGPRREFDEDRELDRRDRGFDYRWHHGRRGGRDDDDRDSYRGGSDRDSYRDSGRDGRGWDRD
jgi:hypothetical protein